MDLNYLYHRHQLSLFRADEAANSEEVRRIHRELAEGYAARIADTKAALRSSVAA